MLLPLVYALAGTLWIAGSDFMLAQWLRADSAALAWAGTLKGFGFIVVTAIILFVALRSRDAPEDEAPEPSDGRRSIAVLLAASTLLVLATAVLLFYIHGRNLLEHARQALYVDAHQAADVVADALAVRRLHASGIAESALLAETTARWQESRERGDGQLLQNRLEAIARERDADSVVLIDGRAEVLLAIGAPGPVPPSRRLVEAALASRQPEVSTRPVDGEGGLVLETAVPLAVDPTRPSAVLLVRDRMAALGQSLTALRTSDPRGVQYLLIDDSETPLVLAASSGLESLAGAGLPEPLAAVMRTTSGRVFGDASLAVERVVRGTAWRILAVQPAQSVLAPLQRVLLAGVATTLAVAAAFAAILLAWWHRHTFGLAERARRAERRAAALLKHFATANRHANDAVFLLDDKMRLVEANPVAAEVYGYAHDELLGKTVADLWADGPAGQQNLSRRFGAALAGSTRFETLHRRKDGSTFPVEVSSRRFSADGRTYTQSIVRDISDRKQAEAALLESEERFRATFEQAAVGIAHVAPDGRWLRVNEKLCQILGYTREQLLGRTFQEFTHPDDLPEDLRQVRAILAGSLDHYSMEKRYIGSNGSVVWVRLSVSLKRRADGEGDYFISVMEDITAERAQRMEVEQLSRERAEVAERLQRQFAGMPFGCAVMDAGMRVLDVNPAFERIFGWSRDEFLTAADPLALIVPAEVRRNLDPAMAAAAATGSSLHRVNENLTRDGRRIVCRWTNVPLPGSDGRPPDMLSMCEDYTDRIEAERELREREARFRTLAELSPVGVFRAGPDAHVVYVNPAMLRILGRTDVEASGFGWMDAVHPDDRPRIVANIERLRRGEAVGPEEGRAVHPDGSVIWCQIQVASVRDSAGVILGYIGTVLDITPFKDLERTLSARIAERTGELRVAKERAEASDRAKTAFLATMSHELRTPLNSIIGFTSVLLERLAGPLNDQQERQLAVIRDSSHHLLALINDLLDVARIESGQVRVKTAVVDAASVLSEVVQRSGLAAQQKGLDLRLELAEPSLKLVTDERRLNQILTNLVSNGIKFTERGAVVVRARRTRTSLHIEVADTGIGMREIDLPTLFTPFRQLEPPDGRLREGTGLGLAISRRLATVLGGTLDVSSRFGEGSTFTLVIPLSPEEG